MGINGDTSERSTLLIDGLDTPPNSIARGPEDSLPE